MGGNISAEVSIELAEKLPSIIPPEVIFLTRDEVAHMIQEIGPDYIKYGQSFWQKEIDGTKIMETES